MAERVSAAEFDSKVLASKIPVLVDFYSDSCIPCKRLSPVLSQLESEYAGRLGIVKVNVNFESELVSKYEVLAAPTLVLFKDGSEAGRHRGTASKDELIELINSLV
ncbi:MAG: thioredoxin fold domain-containing protein [Ruminococcus sp.]|nr:thioredoxin fold domain-containing protein [Ruminococcus sp.]